VYTSVGWKLNCISVLIDSQYTISYAGSDVCCYSSVGMIKSVADDLLHLKLLSSAWGGGDYFISKSNFGKQAHIFKIYHINFYLYRCMKLTQISKIRMHSSKFKFEIHFWKKFWWEKLYCHCLSTSRRSVVVTQCISPHLNNRYSCVTGSYCVKTAGYKTCKGTHVLWTESYQSISLGGTSQ